MIIETEELPELDAPVWGASEPNLAGEVRYWLEATSEGDLDDFDEEDFDDEFDDDFEEELEDEYELSEFEELTDEDLIEEDDDADLGVLGGDFVDEDAEPEEAPLAEEGEEPAPPDEKGKAKSKGKGKAKPADDEDDFGDEE